VIDELLEVDRSMERATHDSPDSAAQSRPQPNTHVAKYSWPAKLDLFGIGVTATNYDAAVTAILEASSNRQGGIVTCHAVHAIVTFSRDPVLRDKLNSFDMVTADGQPVRWALNLLHRANLTDRVYGPELMLRVCRAAAAAGIPIYLYGGDPVVAARLPRKLERLCPGLVIAGSEAPPFRPLTQDEDWGVVNRINQSGAGLVFVGLGCPKQDLFAFDHRHSIHAVQVCVGAAFDFHAGVKRMAPLWMQRRGLEWLYRLIQEPKRLWRRYFVTNSLFLLQLGAALATKWSRHRTNK